MPTEKESKPEETVEEEEVEAKADTPQWAMELGAKFDKMTDAFVRVADGLSAKQESPKEDEVPPAEDEEVKADDVPKEDEVVPPKEDEEEMKSDEEKADDVPAEVSVTYTKADLEKAVEKMVKKRFEVPAEKRSKVPSTVEQVLSYNRIAKMSWSDVEKEAEKRGAPGARGY